MWSSIPRTFSALPRTAVALQAGCASLPGSCTDATLAEALRQAIGPAAVAAWQQAARRADKPERRWDLPLPGGNQGELRRPKPGDALALGNFLRRPHFGPVVDPADPTPVIDGVRELLWQATARDEDAFVLVGQGQVLGVAMIERTPESCEQGLDLDWLSAHGLAPEQVCISRMALAQDLRGHGIGHALKAAQVVAAGDAGYRAVASLAGMTVGRAIAARAGGWVSSASGAGWVLVPTRCWPDAKEPAAT